MISNGRLILLMLSTTENKQLKTQLTAIKKFQKAANDVKKLKAATDFWLKLTKVQHRHPTPNHPRLWPCGGENYRACGIPSSPPTPASRW